MNIAKTIASVMAVIILLMAVALPVINSMEEETGTPVYSQNANDGTRMAKARTYAATYENTADGATSGGTVVGADYIVVSDTFYMKTNEAGALLCEAIPEGESAPALYNCSTVGDSVTISGSSWTISRTVDGTTNTYRGSFSWIFYPSESGAYLLTSAPVKVDDDGEIVSFGHTAAEGRAVMHGTISSGMTVDMAFYAVSNIAINASADGYTYDLASVTFKSGTSSITNTANLIVPLEYTSGMEKGIVSTLVGIIPVILVAALLVGIAASVLMRDRDY